MDPNEAIPRIFLSLVLGAIIGLEREFTQKSAGLRTHILVTLGSTIFTIVSLSDFYHGLSHMPYYTNADNRVVRDPSRVAAQIVAGIGFIGGGAVLRHGTTVRGLTTAASLWTMASIGMMVGIGQFRLAIISTILAFLVLFTIGKMERHFFAKNTRTFNRLRVSITTKISESASAQGWMEQNFHDRIIESKVRSDADTDKMDLTYVVIATPGKWNVTEISRQICRLSGVSNSNVKTYFENEPLN